MLWDVDYTLLSAVGLGNRLYRAVFQEMFGCELTVVAPKAGRTDRAIILDTLALAGVASPADQVEGFLAALGQVSASGAVRADVRAMAGAAAAIDELALIGVRQSVLTGNIRPLAALKLRLAGLGSRHLDLAVGAYGDVHEVRAELVPVARLAAGQAYGTDFAGCSTVLVGDTPLDVEAALATGARAVGVATGTYSAASLAAAGAHIVLPDLTDAGLVLAAVTGLALVLCGVPCRSAAGQRPGGGSRPRSIAVVTAAVRSDTPSLPNARSRWVFTVASPRNSSAAIVGLLFPAATRRSGSRSR